MCSLFIGPLFCVVQYISYCSCNFQRWMSWLEHRWRAQRSVMSIVNCRIPWINSNLNVHCAFGISLKACLLQSLCYLLPVIFPASKCGGITAHACVSRCPVFSGGGAPLAHAAHRVSLFSYDEQSVRECSSLLFSLAESCGNRCLLVGWERRWI